MVWTALETYVLYACVGSTAKQSTAASLTRLFPPPTTAVCCALLRFPRARFFVDPDVAKIFGYSDQTDMESKRVVSRARAEQFATEVGGILCETSAKENWGVNELFAKVP